MASREIPFGQLLRGSKISVLVSRRLCVIYQHQPKVNYCPNKIQLRDGPENQWLWTILPKYRTSRSNVRLSILSGGRNGQRCRRNFIVGSDLWFGHLAKGLKSIGRVFSSINKHIPIGCPTIQFNSDTNSLEWASDFPDLRDWSHKTVLTSDISCKSWAHRLISDWL